MVRFYFKRFFAGINSKLKHFQSFLISIIHFLKKIVRFTDPEIRISFGGKSCEKVTGFLPEQFTSKISFWLNCIHPSDKKKTLAAIKNISPKGSLEQPFRWKYSDGKYKSFINYIRFAVAESGRPAYIVGIWQEAAKNDK